MKRGRRFGYVAWAFWAACLLFVVGSACTDSTAPRLPPPTVDSDTTNTGKTTGLLVLPATDALVRV
jgi:hypothetical protein